MEIMPFDSLFCKSLQNLQGEFMPELEEGDRNYNRAWVHDRINATELTNQPLLQYLTLGTYVLENLEQTFSERRRITLLHIRQFAILQCAAYVALHALDEPQSLADVERYLNNSSIDDLLMSFSASNTIPFQEFPPSQLVCDCRHMDNTFFPYFVNQKV